MSDKLVRIIPWPQTQTEEGSSDFDHEWLVTNGIGGFASSTVAGVDTRRYHGLLVAALPAPKGRTIMLSHLHDHIQLSDGPPINLSDVELTDQRTCVAGLHYLESFRLGMGLPVWRYEIGTKVIEKRILMPIRKILYTSATASCVDRAP